MSKDIMHDSVYKFCLPRCRNMRKCHFSQMQIVKTKMYSGARAIWMGVQNFEISIGSQIDLFRIWNENIIFFFSGFLMWSY